jgi:hypothetical protein
MIDHAVVFSMCDNVQALAKKKLEESGKVWIEHLDKNSAVPHYLAKGKGGEEVLLALWCPVLVLSSSVSPYD